MAVGRRGVLAGLAALTLPGCLPGGGPATSGPRPDVARAVPDAGFDAWVAGFRPRALARGIDAGTFDRAFRGAGLLPAVIERDRNQTEFTRTLEDYLAIAASDERVAMGRQMRARHAGTLDAIAARYGVPPEVVTAVWGLESRYGERRGDFPVVWALATLAYDGRRADFAESQLVAALRILQQGDTSPERMLGSWAGAMGHTQFIPTSYLAYAVDFTGDGRRDIWGEDPADALASTAAYLARSGWRAGQPWVAEVRVPPGFSGPLGRGRGQGAAAWAAAGVTRADGAALGGAGTVDLLQPQGAGTPVFAVWPNFAAILRYNNAVNYGLGVGHLANRIAGGGGLRGSFPADAGGLTLDDRKELQRRLTARGYDTGGTDGVIGPATIAAIRAFEAAAGLPVTGEATRALLDRLG